MSRGDSTRVKRLRRTAPSARRPRRPRRAAQPGCAADARARRSAPGRGPAVQRRGPGMPPSYSEDLLWRVIGLWCAAARRVRASGVVALTWARLPAGTSRGTRALKWRATWQCTATPCARSSSASRMGSRSQPAVCCREGARARCSPRICTPCSASWRRTRWRTWTSCRSACSRWRASTCRCPQYAAASWRCG